jgi:alpha-tubulin suppressor-like RCC1 family protein
LIEKIFCGYHSCYAISNVGDIYAWGNPRNNRLTRDFEDKLEKKPKQINIVWKNDTKAKQQYDDIDEEESNTKKMDEKDIMLLLNSKLRLPNVDELFV